MSETCWTCDAKPEVIVWSLRVISQGVGASVRRATS